MSSNASLSSDSTASSTRSASNTVTASTAITTPAASDHNTQLKMAGQERKSELGSAIICMSVIPIISKKINDIPHLTCHFTYSFLKTTYGSKLTVAKMTYIDKLWKTK